MRKARLFSRLVIAALLAVIFFYAAYQFWLWSAHDRDPDYFSIDACMDQGGCWDGVDKVCREHEPNAQELCNRSRPKRP